MYADGHYHNITLLYPYLIMYICLGTNVFKYICYSTLEDKSLWTCFINYL